jgi:hypothetical protein
VSTKALVIDGPLKGQLVGTDRLPLVYEETTGATSSERPPVRVYFQHTWMIMGRGINILSVHTDWREIPGEALWDMIITDGARQAVIW